MLGGLPSAQREIGQYLWTLSSINLAVGVVTGVAVAIVGSPNPTLWSVLAGFLNFVPYLGPMLMMILLLLAGLLSYKDLTPLLLPMLSFMLIHFIESTFISPGGVGRHLFLSTLAVFLSVMIWGWLWGIVGALIAVPMLIGLRSICRQVPRLSGWCLYMDGDTPPDTEETQPTKGSRTAHSWKFWGYHL